MMRRIVMLLLVLGMVAIFIQPACANSLYVGEEGEYSTIQEAINAAEGGDTIYVDSGTYEGCVLVNKSVSLVGEDAATTIVCCSWDDVITVAADKVSITGLTVKDAPAYKASIRVEEDKASIKDCILQNSSYGLMVVASQFSVSSINANGNSRYGIAVIGSHLGELFDNSASNNGIAGIYLHDSHDLSLKNSTMNNNTIFGLYLGNIKSSKIAGITASFNRYGAWLRKSDNNQILTSNITDNVRYGILLTDSTAHEDGSDGNTVLGNTITGNMGGMYVYNSDHNTIQTNTISSNTVQGCVVWAGSTKNTLISNSVNSNRYGITLLSSTKNTIEENTVDDNTRVGIMLVGASDHNSVKSNSASESHYGIYIHDSQDNTIEDATCSESFVGVYLGNASSNDLSKINAHNNAYGVYLRKSSQNSLKDINSSSNTNYSYVLMLGSNDNTLSVDGKDSEKGGVYIADSSENKITAGSYYGGKYGAVLLNASANELSNYELGELEYGVYMSNSSSNRLEDCKIIEPQSYGVFVGAGSDSNELVKNSLKLPGKDVKGIYLAGEDNVVSENEITSSSTALSVVGIYVEAAGSNTLESNVLKSLVTGIWVVEGDEQTIEENDIDSCAYGIQLTNGIEGTYIHSNTIEDAKSGVYVLGDSSENGTGETPTNNTPSKTEVLNNVLGNNDMDVYFYGGAPTAEIHNNDLSKGDTGVAVSGVAAGVSVDATNNWWGARDGPGPIASGSGVNVTENVLYNPWLRRPPKQETPVASPV